MGRKYCANVFLHHSERQFEPHRVAKAIDDVWKMATDEEGMVTWAHWFVEVDGEALTMAQDVVKAIDGRGVLSSYRRLDGDRIRIVLVTGLS